MTGVEVVVAVAIVIGLIGVLVPVLPGSLLVFGAVLVWATETGDATAWVVFAVAACALGGGAIVKYAVPGRRLKDAGIPTATQRWGVALGVVGFFVVPVVGLFLGFVLGIYLAERRRLGAGRAWPSTVTALRAAGLSILIELTAAMVAGGIWLVGVALT